MAYTHSKYEILVAKAASLASLADIGNWSPGYVPHIIRAVALRINNVLVADGVVKVDKIPKAGVGGARGDGDVAVLNLVAATHLADQIIYKDGLDVEILPGDQIVFEVTNVTGAGDTVELILYVEPRWETPANNVDQKATA